MKRKLSATVSDPIGVVMLIIALVSVITIIFGVVRYIDANNELAELPDVTELQEQFDLSNPANSAVVLSLGAQRREAFDDREMSVYIAGGGVIALGVIWLFYNLYASRRSAAKRETEAASETAPSV